MHVPSVRTGGGERPGMDSLLGLYPPCAVGQLAA